jgi:DNA topoisomerase-1
MSKKYYKKQPTTQKQTQYTTISSTTKYLIIVESPSKCAKIEHFLGLDYACIASNGHIQAINGLKSIDTKSTFLPKFSQIPEKKEHIKQMQEIIAKFPKENVILATDDDREGEAIAWHICKVFDLPVETTPRIIFHEITKPALELAVKTQIRINMDLVCAQQARQILDIIVGYSISPFLWKYLYNNTKKALSAGRCQTPALRLVYENEIANTQKELQLKYKVKGYWTSQQIPFNLSKEFDNKEDSLDFLKKTIIYKHKMEIMQSKETTRAPPKPFNTSRLLQSASNILKYSPKETMNICQKLYQNGLITYMRTESQQYSKQFVDQMREYIIKTYGSQKYVRNEEEIVNKNTSLPHEAVRVTNIYETTKLEDKQLKSLYKLILKNTIESCMSVAKIMATEIRISAPIKTHYSYINETPVWLGWLKYAEKTSETDGQTNPVSQMLLFKSIISTEKPIEYKRITCETSSKNNHTHYTEAILIQELEKVGIGRPSTFASIVDTIQERDYVKKKDIDGKTMEIVEYELESSEIKEIRKSKIFGAEKQKLVIQPIGILTVEFLLNYFDELFDYEYTKNMENKLDKIVLNEDWLDICKETMREIKEQTKKMSQITKQTFAIEEGYEYMFGKYGQIIKHTLEDETIEYLPIKRDININLEKLKRGEYKLDDMLEVKSRYIGKYGEMDVNIKLGRYGAYVEYGETRECIDTIKKPIDDIDIEDIKQFINKKTLKEEKEIQILRELNSNMSIRKGKYGVYAYYKRPDMKKPQFLNIKKSPCGYLKCEVDEIVEWLCQTYNLPK